MVDWNRVEELKEELGEDEFPEVIEVFLEEFEGALAGLDPDSATPADMHFLKGSAATLGFADTKDLCVEAETQLKQDALAGIDLGAILAAYFTEKADLLAHTG